MLRNMLGHLILQTQKKKKIAKCGLECIQDIVNQIKRMLNVEYIKPIIYETNI